MRSPFRLNERACGLLLHPTSLPGPHGSGDLGPAAHRFVDFLAAAGQRWWQMLPTGPPGPGNSPYSSCSAFAGSPLLISLERLADEGLLSAQDLRPVRGLRADRVSYGVVKRFRMARLRRAFDSFARAVRMREAALRRFRREQGHWLADHSLFAALKRVSADRPWTKWPRDLRLRNRPALMRARQQLRREIDFEVFLQYQFHRQWAALRRHARRRGVGLIGDIPIFVAHDSSDVWANRKLFQLDADGHPRTVSGVPPDLFTSDGQLWGHPHYRWERHRATHFAWWIARFRRMFDQFDAVRIDHFLGSHRCWAVPGRARTARHGRWIKTPGAELFEAVRRALGRLEIIAEDLGVVTPGALALRDRLGFPGMRLLQFAFADDQAARYHQPHSYPRRCVVYTGTHDNDTTRGWLQHAEVSARRRRCSGKLSEYERVCRYVGGAPARMHRRLMRIAYRSVADLAIVPMQDVLELGSEARMNVPGTARGNWQWRMDRRALTAACADRLRELAQACDRLPPQSPPGRSRRDRRIKEARICGLGGGGIEH